ncbi:MAG: hypothetical protein F7C34_05600 [Desulfurococcales archaeon]|nr:hypothetical protein [Desulfurococcales archaeon]
MECFPFIMSTFLFAVLMFFALQVANDYEKEKRKAEREMFRLLRELGECKARCRGEE